MEQIHVEVLLEVSISLTHTHKGHAEHLIFLSRKSLCGCGGILLDRRALQHQLRMCILTIVLEALSIAAFLNRGAMTHRGARELFSGGPEGFSEIFPG